MSSIFYIDHYILKLLNITSFIIFLASTQDSRLPFDLGSGNFKTACKDVSLYYRKVQECFKKYVFSYLRNLEFAISFFLFILAKNTSKHA